MAEKEDNVDLRLALGNSTQFVEKRPDSNKGVGANADSNIDMAFVASDPLSELVWSPNNGLTLRCANSTLDSTKPVLLWNVGPSNLVLSLPENIRTREENDDRSNGESHYIEAHVESPVNENLDKDIGLATFSQSIPSASLNSGNQIDQVDQSNKNLHTQRSSDCGVNITSKVLSGAIVKIAGGSADSGKNLSADCEVQCRLQYEPVSPLQCIAPREGAEEATLATDQGSEKKTAYADSLAVGAPSKKMESSGENILHNLVRIQALKKTEERLARENFIPLKLSPSKSWMDMYQKKGKAKVLSDVDVCVRLSNNVDDGAESCNSAGYSPNGKRRLNPSESVNDRKRAKTEAEDEAFTSPIKYDSSFMKWISNMVKGYREGPSLDLTLDHSDFQREDVKDIISYNKHSDDGYLSAGFHAMFQSLYSPTTTRPSPRLSEAKYFVEASENLLLANSRSGTNTSLAYPREEEQCLEKSSTAKESAPTSGNAVLPSQLQIVPLNATPLQEIHETNWLSGSRYSGSDSKQINSTLEKSSPNLHSESQTNHNKSGKHSTLGSLWITRFCGKTASTSLQMDERNHRENRGYTNPSNFNYIQVTSKVHSKRKTLCVRDNLYEKEGDDIQDNLEAFSENMVDTVANKEVLRNIRQKKFHKLDAAAIGESQEKIAFMFARRLDALKHISLPDTKGGTSPQMATCLFCGKHGHELRNCLATTASELEAILHNASLNVSLEESCLCLICFRLDHWANACPKKSTRRQQILDKYSSVSKRSVKLGEGDAQDSNFLKKGEGDPLYAVNLNSKQKKYFPLCKFVGKPMEDVPKGMFDAIKRLRLSRVEILKCMNSRDSLSCLNGFFTRLRVGKLEAGQEGTGYYVASITGEQITLSSKDSKKYISVDVGGTQSLVGIQYVSNQDFLEDELVSWWGRTLETGAKVPTHEELKSKFEAKMKFGFC